MLDELPTLELAATAVALVLSLRVLVLLGREKGLVRGRARVESARARDLVGLAILVGALVYAWRAGRATTWLLAASAIAIVAQLVGFYLRSAAGKQTGAAGSQVSPGSELDGDDDDGDSDSDERCPNCGNAALVELVDADRLLGGLNALTPVSAAVCPACGTLTGQVEDASRIPVGAEHGTALRQASGAEPEPLEVPAEHDG